jgi:hypothetical protein
MTDYSTQDAVKELHDIGVKLLAKAERDVSGKKVMELARMYALVMREYELVEAEARRMRLAGDLDPELYKTISEGYDSLGRGIMEIAKSKWLAGDVYVLSKSLRPSIYRRWSSLTEYVRKEVRE